MSPRQFFSGQHWWGKILGFFFGFLIGRSIGALVGFLIGNLFDKGLGEHFSQGHWHYRQEKREDVQKIFFTSTFAVMGHVAKADGRISEEEIAVAKKMMMEMGLNAKQKKIARQYFNQGKQKTFNLALTLDELFQTCHDNPELIRLFVDIQYQTASIEPLTESKIRVLNTILVHFGFAPLYEQYRFYQDFTDAGYQYTSQNSSGHHKHEHTKQNNYQSSNKQQNYQQYTSSSYLAAAYEILAVQPNSSKQDVKRAYRRLISRNHPDKLIAQGLPEEMIKLANKKTQQITKAYQQICTSKGW